MSSSNQNVGTRLYLKRKSDKPEVTRQGVDIIVRDIIETIKEKREEGARYVFISKNDLFLNLTHAPHSFIHSFIHSQILRKTIR